jgi:tRNA (mo5U34)-methyltransferase
MEDVLAEVERLGPYYHTFDLPGGTATKGYFDLRRVARKVPLPASLVGRRCLDAAACEGFWSFEMARRGAAEVVSVDLPDPAQQDWQGLAYGQRGQPGAGLANEHFHVIRRALGVGNVERVDMNVYDVSPEALGAFDYVFAGNILIHLSDPVQALRALRSVMRPGSELLSLEATSWVLSKLSPRILVAQLWDHDDQNRWWTPNKAAHRRLLHAAGFEVLDHGGPLFQPFGAVLPRWPTKLPRGPRDLLFWLIVRRIGPASSWVRARPLATRPPAAPPASPPPSGSS